MSLNIDGEYCAYCKGRLFSDDDVVYCPECGAPHHRECYLSKGECALAELHGTDRQYTREKKIETEISSKEEVFKSDEKSDTEIKCQMCGEAYQKDMQSCPKCGAPNLVRFNVTFDPFGGVLSDYNIADGVTAKEAARFVLSNTHRYIPKFAKINKKNKVSWNWIGFLFPSCWLLSRKMYKFGIIATIFLIVSSLLSYPIYKIIDGLGITSTLELYSSETILRITDELSANPAIMIFALLSSFVNWTVRIITGLFGNYWYKNHTIASIKRIREEYPDNIDIQMRKKGGVNLFMFLMGYFALQYIPVIIYTLI